MTKIIDGNDLTEELFAFINNDEMPEQKRFTAIKNLFQASDQIHANGNTKICINMLAYIAQGNYLFTPLGLAIFKNSSCVEQLLEYVLTLPLKKQEKSELIAGAILHCFAHKELDRKHVLAMLLQLINQDISLNVTVKLYLNEKGQAVITSPLRYAVVMNAVEVVHELLKHGANPVFSEKPSCALDASDKCHARINSSLSACYRLNTALESLQDNTNEKDNNHWDASINISKALKVDAAFTIIYLANLLSKSLQKSDQEKEKSRFGCLLMLLRIMGTTLHLGGDSMMQECMDFHRFCILPFAEMNHTPNAFGTPAEMKRFFDEPLVPALSETFKRAIELSQSQDTQMTHAVIERSTSLPSVLPQSIFLKQPQQNWQGQNLRQGSLLLSNKF